MFRSGYAIYCDSSGACEILSDQDFSKGNPKVARDASGELIELLAELTRDDGSVIVLSEIEEWNATSICYGPVDTDEWYDMRKKRSKAVRITVRSKNELEVRRIYVESSDPWDRGKYLACHANTAKRKGMGEV